MTSDKNLLKQIALKEFRLQYPWWKRSMCQLIKYDDLGVPTEWTFKPQYDRNTICFEGKDMAIKHAIKILDERILTSTDEQVKRDAESSRFTILMLANDFVFKDKF
jgi:hypothetical protein